MTEIIRTEITVSQGIDEKDPHTTVITPGMPVMTFAPGGVVYLTPQENETALKAAAKAFASALPTDRGYNVVASLVSETKSPM
ncbi:hypothetical protein FGW37_05385 [Streptomyces rectiverticillatus]|uniref:hypothetical protein n=1 Tax=Streptomyces rectiverticillatus TaxID=173860 RepID=UPI0015C3414B|nr:hypothetical protein [Streptomyces rectiverticillatus]QLE71110.1 hypothetical protein FGW37_05385 [Streptomyces rectiverticillatus]